MVYIKRIEIRGFKSYKDQTMVEPFSPHHNVIVGRNGAGKSNFFQAIQFVLSEPSSAVRADAERASVLHEGAGQTVTQAYVEIVFDNSDGRFPMERDEVVIRRTIGLKKDEYYLDSRHVTKTEIVNLLESAGFSRSNPYFIVQQGKVKQLTTMQDSKRLELLKEVAGTKVYDERREQVTKLMEEAGGKIQKVRDLIAYIEERLAELEEEKKELGEYQKLDKERRALEYAIYDQQLRQTRQSLEEIEEQRRADADQTSVAMRGVVSTQQKLKDTEHAIKMLRQELAALTHDRDAAQEERQELIRARTKVELDVRDAEEAISAGRAREKLLRREQEDLKREVDRARRELDTAGPAYRQKAEALTALEARLEETRRRIEELYAKQGRKEQFRTAAERDRWLEGEIKSLEQQLASKRKLLSESEKELKKLRDTLAKLEEDVEKKTEQLTERAKMMEEVEAEISAKLKQRDDAQNERKEMWRRDADLDRELQTTRAELAKAERLLQSSVNRGLQTGLDVVKTIVARHNITGVYGPLIELISTADKFMTAVEVTAGTSLFHVVVDTDDTAARIITQLNREKENPGRVTFIPLNRVQLQDITYPETQDALPMISKLEFDPRFRPAVQQVFGKTLIVRNLEVGAQLAKENGLNCVTMDGDQVSRRGAITGGFVDVRVSRMEAMKKLKMWREKAEQSETESRKLKSAIEQMEQTVTQLLSELSRLENRRAQLRDTYDQVQLDHRAQSKELLTRRQFLEDKEKAVATLRSSVEQLEASVARMRAELGSPLTSQLSAAEQKELTERNAELDRLRQEVIDATRQKADAEARFRSLEEQLNADFLKRQVEVADELHALALGRRTEELARKQHELEGLEKSLETSAARIKAIQEQMDEDNKKLRELTAALDDMKAAETEASRTMQEGSKGLDRLLQRRADLIRKKEELLRKIRDLGALPAEAEEYAGVDSRELLRKLHSCNEKLKKYAHVNKKAFDQYVNFTDQRENLVQRLQEAEDGSESIAELMATLDQRKDEAIERTFKQVAKHFSDVFKELVPQGSASLVMQTSDEEDDSAPAAAAAAAAAPKPRVRRYVGVGIRVNFTGSGETVAMNLLSGGQKSLVALALIFAIQRCDPAPFYLFDEIDAALDAAHRTAVANLVRRQCKDAQFIITTFRPELVQHADKCYCVVYSHKVSSIHVVPQEEALRIVMEEAPAQDAAAAAE